MRIALVVEYDGTSYAGWQHQPHAPQVVTIQAKLEEALSNIADHPINVVCAGRTDAGVHAKGQVVHFDTEAIREDQAWVLGTNSKLPADICVRFAKQMPDNFHARFSAIARRYCYVIDTRATRPALLRHQVTWYPQPLDEIPMAQAAQYLMGEHDFSAFRAKDCQSLSAKRCIHHIEVKRQQHFIFIEVKANAFLHHMVRNIVGVLMVIGAAKAPPEWIKEVLESKDRQQAANTARPTGLYLVEVEYPKEFNFIENHVTPHPGPLPQGERGMMIKGFLF